MGIKKALVCSVSLAALAGCRNDTRGGEVLAEQRLAGASFLAVASSGALCPAGSLVTSPSADRLQPFPLTLILDRVAGQRGESTCELEISWNLPKGYRMKAPPLLLRGGVESLAEVGAFKASLKYSVAEKGNAQVFKGQDEANGTQYSWSLYTEPVGSSACAPADTRVTWVYNLGLNMSGSAELRYKIDTIDASSRSGKELIQFEACSAGH